MKRTIQTLLRLLLIALLTIGSVLILGAQTTPSPQPTPPRHQGAHEPVVLEGETLFFLQTGLGGASAQERAQRASQRVKEFADQLALPLSELELYAADPEGIPVTSITASSIGLITISNTDAQLAGKPRSELAQEYFQHIQEAVKRYRQERSLQYFLRATLWSVIATVVLFGAVLITNNLFARIYHRLKVWQESYIRPVRLGNWELIQANQLDNLITGLARLVQAAIILGLLATYFPFVLKRFPWTRELAETFQGYLVETFRAGWKALVGYLPNFLTIVLVIFVASLLLKLAKPFFRELGEGRFSLPGFYPEWADATYRLVTFLILAMAAVIIFPLLPGFQSTAFQGVSVFLGLLISLGSTSIIANLISGSVLIYTRAFRVGDLIKIGDISGKVMETTLLVTRILAPTNIVISIPNSQISNSSIENFSFSHRELKQPFIVRTSVYLGYEVPWREAYQALIQAALQTEGTLQSPKPFVLQGELNEVYVTYLLNAYIDTEYLKEKKQTAIEEVQSQLNENIRDCCAKAGIRIFAPSYEADPNEYGPAADRAIPPE